MRYRIFIALMLVVFTGLGTPASGQAPKGAAKRPAGFLNGPPFTLDQVLEAIKRVRQGVLPDGRLRLAIQNRGLDFKLTPEDTEKLKDAKPTQGLFDLILSIAKPPEPKPEPPPPPPPPPPKPKLGTLQLACEPAECTVLVNGKPAGDTARGQITVKELPAGLVSVSVQKNGYHVVELKAQIDDGKVTPVTAALEPTKETMRAMGKQLFDKMIGAIGGDPGLAYWGSLHGVGTATLVNKQAKSSRWAMETRLLLPDLAALRLTTATKKYEATLVRSAFAFAPGMPEPDEVEHMLALIRDFQLGAVAKRMQSAAATAETRTLTPRTGEDLRFTAVSSVERWTITLQPDYLPKQVRMESAVGVGIGLTVTYADYQKTGATQIPRTQVFALKDAPGHGLDLRLDRLEAGPPFTEEDIRKKRRLFGK